MAKYGETETLMPPKQENKSIKYEKRPYMLNMDCDWLLSAPPGKVISIEVKEFDLESPKQWPPEVKSEQRVRCLDYLEV